MKAESLKVGNRDIKISNVDKVLYPAGRFTKGQVIDYYIRISEYLLPHLKDRPVTLKRFPDGVRGQFFYEKNAPGYTPQWVRRFPVPSRTRHSDINYILINDLPTLVWLANAANLEIHPFLHRVPRIDRPTSLVFDLDPGEGSDILTCARAAFLLREVLSELSLECLVKVSGSKGLQMYVPLNSPVTYTLTNAFAKALAELMEQRHSDLIVSRMAKELRASKVFIDWSQNSDFKTTVGVYSLRAKSDRPYVSMPVTWDELESAMRRRAAQDLYFGPEAALERAAKLGDLFSPVLKLKQHLPKEFAELLPRALESEEHSGAELQEYRRKRDFAKTPEPQPEVPERSRQGGRRRFVIQKHDASHLHYDFRLEMQGALKSWAVPKGPPYESGTKRLAMATEDHPLDYLSFEGIIPQGQYGGGTVMVWDIGTYELIEGNYYKGYLKIYLEGHKLKGEWTLTKPREDQGNNGQGNKWYLVKTGDSMPALSAEEDDRSATSRRNMRSIAESPAAQWQSNRPSKSEPSKPELGAHSKPSKAARRSSISQSVAPENVPDLSSLPKARLEFVAPMLAKLVSRLPEGSEWSYEIKLDGYRALALRNAAGVVLFSRRGNRLNRRFPGIVTALRGLQPGTMLDGEIVALDVAGKPSFNALQNMGTSKFPLYFYAFDLLAYEGKDARRLPQRQRRMLLEKSALSRLSDPIRVSPVFDIPAADLVEAVRAQGLEGVVAKRTDSPYESGKRSGAWSKYRMAKGQELVVGGYLPGSHGFDSLLVGYYEGDRLLFVGKVRNGFVPEVKEQLTQKFKTLATNKTPFDNLPEPKTARRGEALTKEVMKKCRWVKPRLVIQVDFTEWTEANHLRHSRFAGLREDKDPREVTHERAT
jgi:bifunctional non-homologous end joining protein LigD